MQQRPSLHDYPFDIGQEIPYFLEEDQETDARPRSVRISSNGFIKWYEEHLNSHPVTTKAITGFVLWGIGDFIAQVILATFQYDSVYDSDEGAVTKKEFQYDFSRTERAMFFGFAIHAPLSHVHFNFLEWMTKKGGFTGLQIPVFKTIMDQVCRFLERTMKTWML